jgi:hypothetical protein
MTGIPPCPERTGLLRRLLRDRAGNVLAMTAAALLPLIGLIGGGIDIGRAYLSQSRLQQACDSGVLAARKRLGTEIAVTGEVPDEAVISGERFFNLNFRNGVYGTEERTFEMTLEDDFSISGRATVAVPTTLMAIFGFDEMPVEVVCQAQLNMSNMDVMMVLDTTGSMNETNPGDSQPKIAVLRDVVRSFHAQLEANKAPGTRTRYGFVPYSMNVNVGYLLQSDWVVDEMAVPARVTTSPGPPPTRVRGTAVPIVSYVTSACPRDSLNWVDTSVQVVSNGRMIRSVLNGTDFTCTIAPVTGLVTVSGQIYTNYVIDSFVPYEAITVDVSALKGSSGEALLLDGNAGPPNLLPEVDPLGIVSQFRGCIMERATYEIGDYDGVDQARAIDLDIDRIPDPNNPDTQWRPLLSEISITKTPMARNIFDLDSLLADVSRNLVASSLVARPVCPAPARRLAPMTAAEVAAYVDALRPNGNTYHDIGMIWGGRLLSPTGLFAAENADVPGRPTSRHMVFLTDGHTVTTSASLTTYGIEAVDKRRWSLTSPINLNQTVESRFAFACEQVKNRNITVWVISFGDAEGANPIMEACAGTDRYFVADDAEELEEAFATIARRMGELRVTR